MLQTYLPFWKNPCKGQRSSLHIWFTIFTLIFAIILFIQLLVIIIKHIRDKQKRQLEGMLLVVFVTSMCLTAEVSCCVLCQAFTWLVWLITVTESHEDLELRSWLRSGSCCFFHTALSYNSVQCGAFLTQHSTCFQPAWKQRGQI